MQNLVDYFVITGLNTSSGLEPDKLAGDNLHCAPLDRPFKAQVLEHFPENVSSNPFDHEAVCMLCHPRGLKFRTHNEQRPASFHTFLITREDGSRIYGATLTFYESMDDTKICIAMKTLQDMHMAELSNEQSHTLYSHLPSSVYKRSPRMWTKRAVGRVYDMTKDTLYVTRTMCLLSVLPLVNTFERFLSWLYEMVVGQLQTTLPLESYVYNLIYEIPLSPPGRSVNLICSGENIVCQRPGPNELPLLDYSLRRLFELLGAENVVGIFTSFLLEHQVLLYSADCERLMLVAECVSALMFPFAWQHVYVPILPASMLHFLDAPVPFIMGLSHLGQDDDALNDLAAKANMCFVNIDTASVELPEDLPEFPYKCQLIQDCSFWLRNQPRPQDQQSPPGPTDGVGDIPLQHRPQQLHPHPHPAQNQDPNAEPSQRDSGFRDSFYGYEADSSGPDVAKSDSMWSLPNKMDILQQSEAMAKITALAKRTGVITSLDDISETLSKSTIEHRTKSTVSPTKRNRVRTLNEHDRDLITNNIIREVYLHYFLQIFHTYEHFVNQPTGDIDMESWLANRECMQNFDKAAFLGDQPEGHLPFLSAFIETQMFTTFTDNNILAQWEEKDPNLALFEQRLQSYKDEYGDRRMKIYNRNTMANEGETLIVKRAVTVDVSAPLPHSLEGATGHFRAGAMPKMSKELLNTPPKNNLKRTEDLDLLRRRSRLSLYSEHLQLQLSTVQKEKFLIEQRSKGTRPKVTDINNAHMAQTNWKFVETLLKEIKAKSKRILVEKMGREAIELGHREALHVGVEENTLIASLCDLLERIWSHGLQNKQGKSALWWHLLSFQEQEHYSRRAAKTQPVDPALLTPGLALTLMRRRYKHLQDVSVPSGGSGGPSSNTCSMRGGPSGDEEGMSGMQTWPIRRHARKPSRDGKEGPSVSSLPVSVYTDMQHIQQITDLHTDVGCARAWVRLALEKKLLSTHLKELLQNAALLKELYKRYAFLRCEDEREQFLFHLLSLNAVDFHCFTNTFTNITIPYRVLIFPRQKVSGSTTTANCWFSLAGHLRETARVPIPKNALDIPLQHKNIGILTTMRLGHDNAGISPKWIVEHVLVRNEVTGHTYRFPCGKPLGKGVDDGALERLLIAEPVPASTAITDLTDRCRTPPRCRSPSIQRRVQEPRLQMNEIQEMLGDAVNNLVKHFYKPERERGSLTALLCGEYGLVFSLEQVFQFGFKSSKLFGKRFVWDFLEKVQEYFNNLLHGSKCRVEGEVKRVMESYCHCITQIGRASDSVGKDGRFQIFVLIGIRDRILPRWISIVCRTPEVFSVYEERSFLRDKNLMRYIIQLLDSLHEFRINLEKSLTQGVDL